MRQETSSYSLLTVLVRGLLEHVVKCDEYNIDTKKESAGAQEIKNHTNTFFRQMFWHECWGPQWCKGPQRFSDASYSSLTGTQIETKLQTPK